MKNFKLLMMMVMIVPVVMRADDKQVTEVTFENKYTNAMYIQMPWREKDAPHTEQIVDKTLKKGEKATYKAPSDKFYLPHFVVTPSNDMAALAAGAVVGGAVAGAMQKKYEIKNGENNFLLKPGKKTFQSSKQHGVDIIDVNSTTSSTDVTDSDSSTTSSTTTDSSSN